MTTATTTKATAASRARRRRTSKGGRPLDVARRQRLELGVGGTRHVHDPARLAGDGGLEEVAGQPAVAEPLVAGLGPEPVPQTTSGPGGAGVGALLAQRVEDVEELVGRVVGKLDGLGEARP